MHPHLNPTSAGRPAYAAALDSVVGLLPCDAAALLKLDGAALRPVAVHGLTEEALHRRFPLAGHPRLATLMSRTGLHRFPPDCGLPDPYDGLIDHPQSPVDQLLPVHVWMVAPLTVHGKAWVLVTFVALQAGSFDAVD